MVDLARLFRPRSIAVIGGGTWCANVVGQCDRMGFAGPVWPVHPRKTVIAGRPAFARLEDLPAAPDAVFIGVNRHVTIDAVRLLRDMGAGGAVCFASGFSEATAEAGDGSAIQAALLEAAGDMPILGPNCYGFVNYLDGAAIWPDQHGGAGCDSGVAIVTQSSNMAINLTMQARGLPVAYVVTAGNQAQIGLADIGCALLEDDRVTALGLHIEGLGDIRAFESLAAAARAAGKPVVALKIGRSEAARSSAVSHTASLAGSGAGASALLSRLGIGEVTNLTSLLEAMKLLHLCGPLPSARVAAMSCSGGEAGLVADTALRHDVDFPPLTGAQRAALRTTLGPMVALANPLDYHTYIWGDAGAMGSVFSSMMAGPADIGCIVVDFPRRDRCDDAAWMCVIEAAGRAREATGKPMVLCASLPENIDEAVAARIAAAGLIPMSGIDDTLAAISVAARIGATGGETVAPVLLPGTPGAAALMSEAEGKAMLARHGVQVPLSARCGSAVAAADAAAGIGFPVVLKGAGAAHKSEAGLVALPLTSRGAVLDAAEKMRAEQFLVEEMIVGGVAELLVGVTRDPAHGFVLTLAAGGVLTELLGDSTSLILPVTGAEIDTALDGLRISRVLDGYRGRPRADRGGIVAAVLAVQDYVMEQAAHLEEVEINPLICTPDRAVAADVLVRVAPSGQEAKEMP